MSPRHCPECRSTISETAAFCEHCGAPLPVPIGSASVRAAAPQGQESTTTSEAHSLLGKDSAFRVRATLVTAKRLLSACIGAFLLGAFLSGDPGTLQAHLGTLSVLGGAAGVLLAWLGYLRQHGRFRPTIVLLAAVAGSALALLLDAIAIPGGSGLMAANRAGVGLGMGLFVGVASACLWYALFPSRAT